MQMGFLGHHIKPCPPCLMLQAPFSSSLLCRHTCKPAEQRRLAIACFSINRHSWRSAACEDNCCRMLDTLLNRSWMSACKLSISDAKASCLCFFLYESMHACISFLPYAISSLVFAYEARHHAGLGQFHNRSVTCQHALTLLKKIQSIPTAPKIIEILQL